MPLFQYTARTLKGDLVNDKIDLPSRDDVIAHLRKNRMVVVQVRAAPKEFKLSLKFGSGVKTRDVVVFTRQFATMINAGLPLVQALDILAQQTENKILADVTRQVVYDVESGQTLARCGCSHGCRCCGGNRQRMRRNEESRHGTIARPPAAHHRGDRSSRFALVRCARA